MTPHCNGLGRSASSDHLCAPPHASMAALLAAGKPRRAPADGHVRRGPQRLKAGQRGVPPCWHDMAGFLPPLRVPGDLWGAVNVTWTALSSWTALSAALSSRKPTDRKRRSSSAVTAKVWQASALEERQPCISNVSCSCKNGAAYSWQTSTMQAVSASASAADASRWPPFPASKLPPTLRECLDHRPELTMLQVCPPQSAAAPYVRGGRVCPPLHAGCRRTCHTILCCQLLIWPQEVACVAVAAAVCASLCVVTHPAGLSLRYAACLALAFGVTLFATRAFALERSYEVCRLQSPTDSSCA